MDLTETIMNTAKFHSSKLTVSVKDNFATLEPTFVYTDIVTPNMVGDLQWEF
jgi:hypothetical protein